MKQVNERVSDMLQYMQPYMEECFYDTCHLLETDLEIHGDEVWNELRHNVNVILNRAADSQILNKKDSIKYVAFSFLKSGIYMDKLVWYISVWDENFYLDEQETAEYYCPVLFQDRYLQDLDRLNQILGRQFIRVQNYEWTDIKMQYAMFYDAVMKKMIKNLSRLIVSEVMESKAFTADELKIIYGSYMDKADILYAGV